jgi:hypothetical protein
MNFWSSGKQLKEYMKRFGTYSFSLKPPALQYTITHLDPPRMMANPGWGDNTKGEAGKPKTPPDIKSPV